MNRKTMKKTAGLIALLLILTMCSAAVADAAELYDQTVNLLFYTDNVTLKATAGFSLDGQWFKTAEGIWQQDGSRAFRQLLLTSPRKDGSELHNGYTIVAEDGQLYVMEVFHPGTYKNGTSAARDSILRRTVETEQLTALGKVLSSRTDLLLGKDALTENADGEIRLVLKEDAPETVNIALNQLARFAAKRYFGMDYDRIRADGGVSMDNFMTVTEGLLYTMRSISVREADITVRSDENGALQHAEGIVSLYVETVADGVKQLDIRFSADVSDRGTTTVKPFDAEDYGVVRADGPLPEY